MVEGFGVQRQTRTPLLPLAIPVSYSKSVVNQKKLLVGAKQILREVHSEKSRVLITLRALWIYLGPANDLPQDLNDYYESLCILFWGYTGMLPL